MMLLGTARDDAGLLGGSTAFVDAGKAAEVDG